MPEFFEKYPNNPKERPLTEAQKRRAESYPACKIPHAMAKKHCKGFDENYERLLGFAMVSYVLCARSFNPDENPGGEDGWKPFAVHWTEKSMLAQEARYWRRREGTETISLDAPNDDGGTIAGEIVDHRGGAEADLEIKEEHDRIISKLKGLERGAVYLYIREGLTLAEVGNRLGVTRERVRQLVASAVDRLQRSQHYGRECKTSGDRLNKANGSPKLQQRRLRNLRKAMKARSVAMVAMGAIPRWGWYIGEPGSKTLMGPYKEREEASALLPEPVGKEAKLSHKMLQVSRRARGQRFIVGWSHAHKYKKKDGWTVVFKSQKVIES